MLVSNINWHKWDTPRNDQEVIAKIRYRDVGHSATIQMNDKQLEVDFFTNVNSVAPGQSAVIYDGDDLICGGIIMKSII